MDQRTRQLDEIEHNLVWVAQRLVPEALREDALGAGILAAMEAMTGYEPSHGVSLVRYATSRGKWALIDFVRKELLRSKRSQQLAPADGPHDPAEAGGAWLVRIVTSITPSALGGGRGRSLESDLAWGRCWRLLVGKLGELDPRQLEVVERLCLLGEPLEEVADALEVTPQSVRRIKRKAFGKLRSFIASEREPSTGP